MSEPLRSKLDFSKKKYVVGDKITLCGLCGCKITVVKAFLCNYCSRDICKSCWNFDERSCSDCSEDMEAEYFDDTLSDVDYQL